MHLADLKSTRTGRAKKKKKKMVKVLIFVGFNSHTFTNYFKNILVFFVLRF